MPEPCVIGREQELAALEAFICGDEPTALVLTGEAGIGKTTLWEAGVGLARERGVRVLSARPSGAETALGFSGLGDLLEGVEEETLAVLPAPQRRALDVALLRAEPGASPPAPLAICAAVLTVLRMLVAFAPLLVAVDDVQWLDASSASVVAFAARRLRDDTVRFLFTARTGAPSPVVRALEANRVVWLDVGPLSLGATRRLLAQTLGFNPSRRTLRRILELAGGNPLFALELGRALGHREAADTDAVPLPEAVEDMLGVRIARLPRAVRRLILAVGLSAHLRVSQLQTLADPGAFDDALEAGLLAVDGDRVRASHPLLAAAVRNTAKARERRQLHLELSRVVRPGALSVLHLALATVVPDAELASEVAGAATAAFGRGAVQEALELAEHALRLTPPEDPAYAERVLVLGEYLVIAGDERRLRELLEPRIAELPAGEARARAHLLLGEAADLQGHEERLEQALAEAAEAPALRAAALATKARLLASVRVERLDQAEAWALEALPIASGAGLEVEWRALRALAWARVLRGRPVDDLRELGSEERRAIHEGSLARATAARLAFRGEIHAARALLGDLQTLAEERGEGRLWRGLHVQLCDLELRAGDVEAAGGLLDEWDEWMTLDSTGYSEWARGRCQALLAATRGVPDEAERWAAQTIAAAETKGEQADLLGATRALGTARLLAHDPTRAAQSLGAVWEHGEREGVEDPGAFPVAADLVEAATELGELDRARAVTGRLRELAEAQDHPWGLATAQRCAAVVQLASGYDDAAARALAEAAAAYEGLGLRFDRARTLLWLGRAQRRCKQRGAARSVLAAAATAFEELGCSGWADEARSELARVSARRAVAEGELTPAEEQVVRLAAGGLSNKEIAGRLFVSVHTVEVHLSHAYAKLGVRSRAQLASLLAGA